MKLNPESQKAIRFPKTAEELAWANDKARMSVGLTRDPRVDLRVSGSARRACCEKALLRNLRAFDDFAIVDIEHDLGRFSAPLKRTGGVRAAVEADFPFGLEPKGRARRTENPLGYGGEELTWLVFYIAYENLERTRDANPRVEEVVRVIKVITLEELGVPSYGG